MGVHFAGAEFCQLEGEGGLIFWQLRIYFYLFFLSGHLLHVFLLFTRACSDAVPLFFFFLSF